METIINSNYLILIYQYIMNHFKEQVKSKQHVIIYLTGQNV